MQLDAAEGDVNANTASGDRAVHRVASGRVKLNSASGDIHVAVVDGTPAWVHVHTVSGSINSALSDGEPPGEGEDAVKMRVHTVSGDISLARARARRAPPHDEGDAMTRHPAYDLALQGWRTAPPAGTPATPHLPPGPRPPSSARYADVLRG